MNRLDGSLMRTLFGLELARDRKRARLAEKEPWQPSPVTLKRWAAHRARQKTQAEHNRRVENKKSCRHELRMARDRLGLRTISDLPEDIAKPIRQRWGQ